MTSLSELPRVRLNFLPTPLVEMKRLAAALGGPRLFVKRDDLTGLGLGGNKTRKLEFLLGEALAQGCDTVITAGAMQSNHCRQTAAAAAAAGLECHLALGGRPPAFAEGNLLLDELFGAVVHWCGPLTHGERTQEIAGELRARGRRPYLIPFGGSNAVGAMGFVAAMAELAEQLRARNERIDCVVIPSASCGTHAGMTVGARIYAPGLRIAGIAIDRAGPGEPPYESALAALANEVAGRLGLERRYAEGDFCMRYGYFGAGYEMIGELEREALRLVGRLEGILLDPVYSGRAMGALFDMIRRGELTAGETVLFWHTGGLPAVFAHARELAGG